MRHLGIAALALLAGCPICDCSSRIDIVEGTLPVAPGAQLSLRVESEGFSAGPGNCRGHWYVNDIAGGNATVGTITDCGLYTAPAVRPALPVYVFAGDHEPGSCADCCAGATLDIFFTQP